MFIDNITHLLQVQKPQFETNIRLFYSEGMSMEHRKIKGKNKLSSNGIICILPA